jgi:hypothetical protein
MIDEWNEKLLCQRCGRVGMATPTQGADDRTPSVLGISDGFKVVQTEHSPDFHCAKCNIPAAVS